MTSRGFGAMFEIESVDMCAGKFPLVLMGGRAGGLVCADPGARTSIGASRNFSIVLLFMYKANLCSKYLDIRKRTYNLFPQSNL
jgi:hypothetical protein